MLYLPEEYRMPKVIAAVLSIALIFAGPANGGQKASGRLPAFPGAEGFGSSTAGGRGGRVIKVTNLNSNGPGSFQAACSAEGPRIVVFEVSGMIRRQVVVENPYITIAGQTAPGAGITVEGLYAKKLAGKEHPEDYIHDIIVRFIRVRPRAGEDVDEDAIRFASARNFIFDHVTCSWSRDECIDCIMSFDYTFQWCTIEETDTRGHVKGQHNYAFLSAYRNARNITLHHNLFANNWRRNPAAAHGPVDIRNNVIYNFRDGLSHEGHTPTGSFNLVGNYYKRGPSSSVIYPFGFVEQGRYYLEDNFVHGFGPIKDPRHPDATFPEYMQYNRNGTALTSMEVVPGVNTHSPQEAYELVLAHAGCLPRDQVSKRTIEEVRQGTGKWGRNAPDNPDDDFFTESLIPTNPPRDSDGDGMPDVWEKTNGLNPADSTDHNKIMESGYTAIEDYCNMLAQRLKESGDIQPAQLHDFNNDGILGISDVMKLLLLASKNPDNLRFDINRDGSYTVSDAIQLLLFIIRGSLS